MKVLVPLDGSDVASRILPAIRRMLLSVPDAEIHLLAILDPRSAKGSTERGVSPVISSVIPDRGGLGAQLPRVVETHGEALERGHIEAAERLDRLAQERLPGVKVVTHVEWSDHPATKILEVALASHAGVIAMATHGRSGISHVVAGSVTEEVLRTSRVPVLVVGPRYLPPD